MVESAAEDVVGEMEALVGVNAEERVGEGSDRLLVAVDGLALNDQGAQQDAQRLGV